jgi:hypothetical protein
MFEKDKLKSKLKFIEKTLLNHQTDVFDKYNMIVFFLIFLLRKTSNDFVF